MSISREPCRREFVQRDHARAPARRPLRILLVELFGQTLHLLGGLIERDAVLQAPDDV
jgi:hypothetical protein